MKKLLLAVMVLVASVTVSKAQFYVGGGLGFWHSPNLSTSFWIEPEAGYSFNERWAVGMSTRLDFTIYSKNVSYVNGVSFYVEPYARYTYFSADKVKLFLDGVVGVSKENHESLGFQIIVRPGISINLTDHFSLVGTFGALGYRYAHRNSHGFGLNLSNSLRFGFYYSF